MENLDQPGTEIDPDPTERIRVETADGSVLDEELFFSGAGLRPAAEVWAATDANGDGRAEVWVNPHDGATGHSLRLVVFADCRPRQVRRAGESGPAEFVHDVTGSSSAAFSFGIECVDMDGDGPAEVVTTEKERLHGSVRWHFVAYRLQSDVVHVVQEQEVTSPPSTPDTRLRWEGQGLRCPLVAHPAGQGLR